MKAQSLDQWVAWGDAAMERGEHYGASRFYAGAMAIDGGRMDLQWKQAEACRLSHQYAAATELYGRVFYKDQGRTYPDAQRWLAEMQMGMGDHDAAEATWNKVLRRERRKDSVTAQRARNAIAGCAIAREALAGAPDIPLEHLPQPVNTYDSEFGARIGPDSALYFSSLRGELNKDGEVIDTAAYRTVVLRSRPQGDGWTVPERLPDAINGTGHNGNAAWTLDGKHLLFTRCVPGKPCRIHIAETTATGHGEAGPLPGLGDDRHSTQPMVAQWEGRELLLFVSDRAGGAGGLDIWTAHLVDGRAVDVHPLPGAVNSPGNETGPWLDAATNTLWFSSDFHPGMGGYDIFHSRMDNDVYGPPVHAGAPINSPANDLYPMLAPGGGELWTTSNRVGSLAAKGETCCNDLYRLRTGAPPLAEADVPTAPQPVLADLDSAAVAAVDRMEDLRRRLPLALYFHNDEPEPRSRAVTTAQPYSATYHRYRDRLPEYGREGDAAAIGAFFRDEVDRGHAQLAELIDGLRAALDAGIPVSLAVRGHASPLARNDYNANLSMRRIESLRNELRTARGGALRSYMDGTAANGARLTITALPFGEERSAGDVSDDVHDPRRSIYSVAAARERRIHIEAIALGAEARPTVEVQRRELGRLKQDQERTITFTVRNRGSAPMLLLDGKADCGCTHAALPTEAIAPGAEVPVRVIFNGRAPTGPLERTVIVRTNGTPERVELTIAGEVVP
ncbi:MAG: DUF1573 domain-containing protein [Flavobacteriales bacterium]|nr:DUF1573 domain-containing protein [Flavobacteriales bacterium]